MGPLSKFLGDIILQAAYIVILLGSVAGLAFGAMLIVDSARVFRINERMGRWFSTHAWLSSLEAPRKLELPTYGRQRIIGIALVACALYALYVMVYSYNSSALVNAFRGPIPPVILQVIFEVIQLFLVVLNIFVLAVGVVLMIRPKLVRAMESWADRQYSTEQYAKSLDDMHYYPDQFVRSHPRLVGWLLVVGCAYILVNLGLLYAR
jgi:hypothetical protein